MYSSQKFETLVRDINVLYLDSVVKRNPGLIEAAVDLHQSGELPPNTYLFDLDAFRSNARATTEEAKRHRISNYFMSKSIGRNPIVCQAILRQGFSGVVTVEVQEAKSLHRYGVRIGHVGHLVQIPVYDIDYVLSMKPEVWTVYSVENARLVSERAQKKGLVQKILLQPVGDDDIFFEGMTGGIPAREFLEAVKRISTLAGVKVVGTTSFPALLYDLGSRKVRPLPNFHTAVAAAEQMRDELGIEITQVNAPGNSDSSTMRVIAENGGTHGEPGNGVAGTNPLQVFEERAEIPAYVYVSEVAHSLGEKVFVHGGGLAYPGGGYGLYPDGSLWVGGSDLRMEALVGRTSETAISNRMKAKYLGMNPFNYNLTLYHEGRHFSIGDTVVYGFATPQIFVTRGWHAVVEGIKESRPKLLGIFDQGNNLIDRQGRLLGESATRQILGRI